MVASKDSSATVVVIIGITGLQGGSVANALIDSPKPYRLAGLTRSAAKPRAQAFADRGVELREVNIEVGNGEAVVKAFEGADILFAVTNFVELLDKQREIDQGEFIIDSAKTASVKLLIWSPLVSASTISSGLYPVASFDSKATITQYLRASSLPYKLVYAGEYLSTFFAGPQKPVRQPDGTYVLSTPASGTTEMPLLDPGVDYGGYVRAAIERGEIGEGAEVLSGTMATFEELVKEISDYTAKTVVYREATRGDWDARFAAHNMTQVSDMFWNMLLFYRDFGYYGSGDIKAGLEAAGITPPTLRELVRRQDKDFLA